MIEDLIAEHEDKIKFHKEQIERLTHRLWDYESKSP